MKKLIDYFRETEPELNYKIKTILELNEKMLLSLSSLLRKYGLKEVYNIKKTILLPNPLDFPKYPNSEVTIIDVVLTYPVSPYVLHKEIVNLWNVSEDTLIVRNEYEAIEQQIIEKDLDRELLDKFNSMKNAEKGSLLSTNPYYYPEETKFDQKNLAGNLFNEIFKEKLSSNRKNPYENFPLSYDNDFNKNIKDAPKVYPYGNGEKIEQDDVNYTSRWGNFWSELTRIKPIIDKNKNKTAIFSKYKRKRKVQK